MHERQEARQGVASAPPPPHLPPPPSQVEGAPACQLPPPPSSEDECAKEESSPVPQEASTSEGAIDGQAPGLAEEKAPNGCGFVRPEATAREEEKAIYNAGMVSADTMYCHHLHEDGRHLVLHGLPSSQARHCCGVIYLSVGWSGKALKCGEQRRPKREGQSSGHDPCTPTKCPYLAEGTVCPYAPIPCQPCQAGGLVKAAPATFKEKREARQEVMQQQTSAFTQRVEEKTARIKDNMHERQEARAEKRSALQDGLHEKKAAVRENVQQRVENIKGAVSQKAEAIKSTVSQKRDAIKDKLTPKPNQQPVANEFEQPFPPAVGQLRVKILSITCQPKSKWHLGLTLCGSHQQTQEQPDPDNRPALEGDLEFFFPVLDIAADLFLSVQKGERGLLRRGGRAMGRACVPLTSLLGLYQAKAAEERELWFFPPDEWHPDGEAKFLSGVKAMPESAMARPATPLGCVRVELELNLTTNLARCYTAPRWVPVAAAGMVSSSIEEQSLADRGVAFGVKRALERLGNVPRAVFGAAWHRQLGVVESGVLFGIHGYLCLWAAPWELPWILFAFFLRLEQAEYAENRTRSRTRPDGEPDGFATPGATHVVVWNDEIESPPKDDRSFKERIQNRVVENNLIVRINKLEKAVKAVPKVLNEVSSYGERPGNALGWVDERITVFLIVVALVLTAAVSFVLAVVPLHIVIWLTTGVPLVVFVAITLNGIPPHSNAVSDAPSSSNSSLGSFLSRIPDAQEASHRFISTSSLVHTT